MVIRTIEKMLRPIRRRLKLMVTRGVVKLINDALGMQELQITALADETLDGVERFQQYGFTGHPHDGAECLILNVGGSRSHAVVVAVDDRRYRLQLSKGEVAMYDDQGQSIIFKRSGIEIASPNDTTHTGNMAIDGNLSVTGTLTLAGINMNTHNHVISSGSSAPGPTGGPQ